MKQTAPKIDDGKPQLLTHQYFLEKMPAYDGDKPYQRRGQDEPVGKYFKAFILTHPP